MAEVNIILNLIWLVLSGLWLALGYVVAGVICCILIVTIPFGLASFRLAGFALWPFGRCVGDRPGSGAPALIGHVIGSLLAGLWLAIGHFVSGVLLGSPVSGIPLG